MDFRRIDLNLLVVLEAVVSEANVSRAARRLHVSQSAMSHSLARLREAFGDPILVRNGRTMEPTPRAIAALPEVRSLLNQVGRIFTQEGRFDAATVDRHIHIGASDYAAAVILPPVVARIREEAPNIRLRVHHAGRVDAPGMLRSGQLDLALGVFNQFTADLSTRPVRSERYLCATSLTAHAPSMSREAYLDASHINVLVQGDTLGLIDEALAREGIERRIALTVAHFSSALALLEGSGMVYTGPAGLFDDPVLAARVRLFEPPIQLPLLPPQLAWSRRTEGDEALRWIRDAMGGAVV